LLQSPDFHCVSRAIRSASVRLRIRGGYQRLLLQLVVLLTLLASFSQPWADPHPDEYERGLIEVISLAGEGDPEAALARAEALVAQHPDGALARLLRADLAERRYNWWPSMAMPALPAPVLAEEDDETLAALREEARLRWRHYREDAPAHDGLLPSSLLAVAPDRPRVLLVDLEAARLYVYANEGGKLTLLADHYATRGLNGAPKSREGDKRTPVGVYRVTHYIPGAQLPDLYGSGALPINYPNIWDRRVGKTGYGIWLHGSPSGVYNRAPRESDGCVVLSNAEFAQLVRDIDPDGRTPVIIAEHVEWLTPAEREQERERFLRVLDEWRRDWESLDTERYLKHYAPESFSDGEHDIATWAEAKRAANAGKSFIKVSLEQLNVFAYPGEPDLMHVEFLQDYRTNHLVGRALRQQYWQRGEDGRWRIVYEGRP
jgi:murein L,D-transpeptidase YafK